MSGSRPRRGVLLGLLLAVVVLLLPGAVAATPPAQYGKVVAFGSTAVPYGQGSFPFQDLFSDGDLVYDSQVSVELVNANPAPVTVAISAEEWTPGTIRELVNVTQPDGNVTTVWQDVPARLDPVWSNSSLSVPAARLGGSASGEVSVPLPGTNVTRPLELRVGAAVWELHVLTPVTSSLAGIYTLGGVDAVAFAESALTAISMLVFLAVARVFARRIRRTPKVPVVWPILWILVPPTFYVFEFVATNQLLGGISPYVYPALIGIAFFPYLPRLWKEYEMTEIEGIEPLSLEATRNPKIMVPIVSSDGGLRCAPETWREALWSHWLGLPEVRGYEVTTPGGKARVQPGLVRVSCPLPEYYRAEATASCWYDARAGIRRARHHLEWWRWETQSVPDLDPTRVEATVRVGQRRRRRFSPHLVAGFLEGTFPPKKPVAEELAGVRNAEVEAHDHERDRLRLAEYQGSYRHLAREWADHELEIRNEADKLFDAPRSADEIRERAERWYGKRKEAASAPQDEPKEG